MDRDEVIALLTERAKWYRDGCDGLEDREHYFASGDVARDAASDLDMALSEIRVLERVITLLREATTPRPPTTVTIGSGVTQDGTKPERMR